MSNLKRFLALVLVVVMAIGGMAMNVSAAPANDIEDIKDNPTLAYAIDILNQLGVVAGKSTNDDGTIVFDGTADVTRQQFALFTARISTALPELFLVDTGASVSKPFTDLTDKTYFPAIDYCAKEGIVLGVGDGKFNPKANVTFQDAVTMLVRSLNYTGLVYPAGFLVKANDIGLIGDNAIFPMNGIVGNTPINRYQMAMLLWNYLFTVKNELIMVINAETGALEPRQSDELVLTKFGFTKYEGYVTGIPGWAADVVVPGPGSIPGYALTGKKMAPATGTFVAANANDIRIGWANYINYTETTTTTGTTIKYNWAEGKADFIKANVGLADKDFEYLLGLKVQIFIDVKANRVKKIQIPARVLGDKIEVDAALNDSDFGLNDDKNAVKEVNWLQLGINEEDAAKYYIGDVTTAEFNYNNLYMFTEADSIMKDAGVDPAEFRLKESEPLFELAKFTKAANKANYRLEYVNNGTTNGKDDFYYVFRPFVVGVRVKDNDDGQIRFLLNATTGDGETVGAKMKAAAARFMDKEITKLDEKSAYFFTAYGEKLDIYGQLTATEKAVPRYVQGGNASFLVGTATTATNATFGFGTSLSKALGSLSTAVGKIANNNDSEYTLFADDNGAFLAAYATKLYEDPGYVASKYAVIIDTPAEYTYVPGVGGVKVFNVVYADTGAAATIYASEVDGIKPKQNDDSTWLGNGTVIRLLGDNKVCTYYEDNFVQVASKEEYKDIKYSADDDNYNTNTKLVTVDTRRATINSGTKIVIYQVVDRTVVGAKVYVYTGNDAELNRVLGLGGVNHIMLVARDPQTTGNSNVVGFANYVFLRTNKPINAPAQPNTGYALMKNNPNRGEGFRIGDDWFYIGNAGPGDGTNVCNGLSSIQFGGAFIEITTEKKTNAYNTTDYNVVNVKDTTLQANEAGDNWGAIADKVIAAGTDHGTLSGKPGTTAIDAATSNWIVNQYVRMYVGEVTSYNRNSHMVLNSVVKTGTTQKLDASDNPVFEADGVTPVMVDVFTTTEKFLPLTTDTFRFYVRGSGAAANAAGADFRSLSNDEWNRIKDAEAKVYAVVYTDNFDRILTGGIIVKSLADGTDDDKTAAKDLWFFRD
ncbi:MAG: S-layer homology domain-containing protein [Oscillospiraceae bacterium]|nr:S-layer homology domain-containing protein [Oscillospiraceae bacterium]